MIKGKERGIMKKFKEYLALLLACTMTVCACPVYGASRGLLPETSVPEDTFVYEETEDFVPGEVIVCVAGGAETLAEDMAAAESTDALLLGASGTDVAAAKEAVSLYTCSLTAKEAAAASGGVTAEEAAETLLRASGEAEKPSEILLLHTEEGKEQEAVDFLCTLPHVEFAELNCHRDFADFDENELAFPGDSSRFVASPSAWKQQWAYNGSSAYGMGEEGTPIWEDKRVNAPVNPETSGYDEDQIVVAILDTGVDYNNPEIAPVLWNCPEDLQETLGCGEYGWNANAIARGEGDPTDPYDTYGHGTHCAGIVGACWKDGGIYGIANNVKIMAVRIGGQEGFSDSDALTGFACVKKAVENGVNVAVTSNSWGGAYRGSAYERVILELGRMGTLTVFASGNESLDLDVGTDTVSGFVSDPYTVIVDSHNAEGDLSSFTNYGVKTTHVSAPGQEIFSSIAEYSGTVDPTDPENYAPVTDGTTWESYTAPVKEMTVTRLEDHDEARENAFRFTGARLATASTAEIGAIDSDHTHLKTKSSVPEDEPPFADLCVDFSEADLSPEDGLFFGFRLTAGGWTPGLDPNFDRVILSVTAVDAAGEEEELYGQGYYVAYGKPISVSVPLRTIPEYLRIRMYLLRYDEEHQGYDYVDPGFAAFDDFLITDHVSAYRTMNGTSMACPAVAGEAAVLAGRFARVPTKNRAKELQARILGSAVPFKNESDKDKNRTGGYANLVRAMEQNYVPVIQEASFDGETGLLTLSGYFFPDAEKAGAEGWYVLLDNTKITNVTWSEDGKTAVFGMGNADQGAKEYAIRMVSSKDREKIVRQFLFIDTGSLSADLMERVDVSGTDPAMAGGAFLGMVPLNGKLYLLESMNDQALSENGLVVWGRDIKKGGAFTRVNNTAVTPAFLGNEDLEEEMQSMPTAYRGKVIFAADYLEPVTQTYVTYIFELDPETGVVTAIPAAPQNYERKANGLGVVSLGEKLAFLRTSEKEDGGFVTETALFENDDKGKLVRRTVFEKPDAAFQCDLLYQEDGTFLAEGQVSMYGTAKEGLFRCTVTEEDIIAEPLTDNRYMHTGEIREKESQTLCYFSAPLKDALITTGIQNTAGNDTYLLKGLSDAGTVTALPRRVDSAKLLTFAVAATDGVYYVLAETRNGSEEEGRLIFCRQDLAELGLATIKNPGDTEKPVPPGPTPTPGPVYGGGGGTVTTNGLAYSKFWVQQNGIWKVVDKNGLIVKNAWLCDDAVTANGNNVWYLLKADGTMASDGLLMDATGNCYSLEQEHKGYFGSLRYKDGYYNVGGKQVYLTFCRDHNGAFGAVLNPDGLAALKAAYGVAAYANGNESIRYTSKF